MAKLIMTRGLPGSGKSTWAANFVRLNPDTVIVNKDDIRKEYAAKGWTWSHEAEKEITTRRDRLIRAALAIDASVISSDTNFGKHEARLRQIAKECKAEFEVKDFTDVPLETCIAQDAARTEGKVGEEVIKRMYNDYLTQPVKPAKYKPEAGTPLAIICDLDGTLALFNGLRGPYDYAKCANDRVNKPVFDIIRLFAEQGTQIMYLSGRDEDKARFPTEDFLATNKCPTGPLFMRPGGDNRKDYIVKQELFDKYVRNVYNVRFVLDDRDQVVKMWRELGLTCLQVAEGAF